MINMDKTTFRILDVLSRDLGTPISINELTRRIRKIYGTAYYKNIYDKIQDLKKQNVLNLSEVGRASIITFDFNNYRLTDILAEMELKKKQEFLKAGTELEMVFLEMDRSFKDIHMIESILIINPENNLKLNRIESLFLLKDHGQALQNEILSANSIIEELQSKHNIKIDSIFLTEKEFLDSLESEETNPLKEMLWDKIVFFSPQAFWLMMGMALRRGIRIKTEGGEMNLAKITNRDLIYNLSRFGYKEMGTKMERGKDMCIEQIITSVLLQDDARRVYAIPVLLAKNKVNYSLLVFLCKKYKKTGRLLGLLRALNKIRGNEKTEDAIKMLEDIKTGEIKANKESIMEKMRLYNAI